MHVGKLTKNVTKDHLQEIFANFGKIKEVDLIPEFQRSWMHKGFAYIEYESLDEMDIAIKCMHGGKFET